MSCGAYRVLPGRVLLDARGEVRAYGGDVVPADDPAIVNHTDVSLDCIPVADPEPRAPAPTEDVPLSEVGGAPGEADAPRSAPARRSPFRRAGGDALGE